MEIKKWKGIKNTTSPERLAPGELAAATDVDIDNTGRIMSREGITEINDTATHSLYSDHNHVLLAHANILKRVNSDLSTTALRTLTNANPISYAEYVNITFYSNGTDLGRVVSGAALEWGVQPPTGQPAASATGGLLPPGRYLYAMTFLRSDGHESGTGGAGVIDLTSGGGITFTSLEVSTNPEVNGKILYLSTPNGEAMYRVGVVPNNTTTVSYSGDATDLSIPLTTQFAGPPPAGSVVRVFNATAYVVVGDTVYYSDPYNLELFRPATHFLRFPGEVGLFECVNAGIYAGTIDAPERESGVIGYLSGERPDSFRFMQLFDYGVIPGSGVRTEASHFQPPSPDEPTWSRPAVVWATRHGVCVGYDNGQCQNLTETRYSFPPAQRGAGLVRQTKGFAQYVVVLQGAGAANNIAP